MSDMATPAANKLRKPGARARRKSHFSLRDLSRQTAEVIGAADALGSVQIRSRDGRSYRLVATAAQPSAEAPGDWQARRERICRAEFTAASSAAFDKMLAGD